MLSCLFQLPNQAVELSEATLFICGKRWMIALPRSPCFTPSLLITHRLFLEFLVNINLAVLSCVLQAQNVKLTQLIIVGVGCLGQEHLVMVELTYRRHDEPAKFCLLCNWFSFMTNPWFDVRLGSCILAIVNGLWDHHPPILLF